MEDREFRAPRVALGRESGDGFHLPEEPAGFRREHQRPAGRQPVEDSERCGRFGDFRIRSGRRSLAAIPDVARRRASGGGPGRRQRATAPRHAGAGHASRLDHDDAGPGSCSAAGCGVRSVADARPAARGGAGRGQAPARGAQRRTRHAPGPGRDDSPAGCCHAAGSRSCRGTGHSRRRYGGDRGRGRASRGGCRGACRGGSSTGAQGQAGGKTQQERGSRGRAVARRAARELLVAAAGAACRRVGIPFLQAQPRGNRLRGSRSAGSAGPHDVRSTRPGHDIGPRQRIVHRRRGTPCGRAGPCAQGCASNTRARAEPPSHRRRRHSVRRGPDQHRGGRSAGGSRLPHGLRPVRPGRRPRAARHQARTVAQGPATEAARDLLRLGQPRPLPRAGARDERVTRRCAARRVGQGPDHGQAACP